MPRRQATQPTENPSTNTDADREEQPSQLPSLGSTTFKIRLVVAFFCTTNLKLPGHTEDLTAVTFQILDEDHTLGNALRYIIMKKYLL
jgi:DNA-directed RNA polymerase I and III subunit RPAC2